MYRLYPVHLATYLGEIHVFSLQALRPILYYKGYARTLIERTVPACRNGGKMDENIFAILALNKPKSFCGVKPLYCSCFFQDDSLFDLFLDVSIEGGTAGGIKDSKAGPAEFNGRTRINSLFSLAARRTRCLPQQHYVLFQPRSLDLPTSRIVNESGAT
jgi:hypothetical protein